MNLAKRNLWLILVSTALLSACGSPGVPLPPSLELARPVSNLRAARKGDKVTLTWSAPTETTDQHNIRHPGKTEICRAVAEINNCGAPIAQIPQQKPQGKEAQASALQTYTDQLPSELQLANPLRNVFYALSVHNSYGRSAGFSNQVQVPSAPTLSPPSNFNAQLSGDGVRLSWSRVQNPPQAPGLRFIYRVYRRDIAAKSEAVAGELPVADQPSPSILDQSFEWEKTYEYRVTIVTFAAESNGNEESVEGDDTPPITVVAHDVFPPATPTGLQAIFSGPGQKPFIDLIWAPNTEADLAGYNVYRRQEGTPAEKINFVLVKSPAYRDATALPCNTYFYSVSAIDIRGNESPRSEEAKQGSLCEY